MRQTLTDLGLEGTQLIVRDADTGDGVAPHRAATSCAAWSSCSSKLEELVKVVQRRGIDFADFLGRRDDAGRLPLYRVVVDGEEQFFHTAGERDEFLREQQLRRRRRGDDDVQPARPSRQRPANGRRQRQRRRPAAALQKNQELHEVKELEKLFAQLEQLRPVDRRLLPHAGRIRQRRKAARPSTPWSTKTTSTTSPASRRSCPRSTASASSGIEIKRFKGLGEMNAEQLWETTLDPNVRMLLRVTLQEAAEAERMFSVLMGEDVERRRQFIEEHALEVKNLDV